MLLLWTLVRLLPRTLHTWIWVVFLLSNLQAIAQTNTSSNGITKARLQSTNQQQLAADIRQLELQHGQPLELGIWLGTSGGRALMTRDADRIRPTASAIKTAFLVELFARYHQALDAVPAGLDEILSDQHPAVAHFSPEQRAEIRQGLSMATVRQIGMIMMGSKKASNLVYNAAANVTTALLGGPAELTQRIHARSPAFKNLHVRRYMLAPRNVTGDNTSTTVAMASVLQQLASATLPQMPGRSLQESASALLTADERYGLRGKHFFKDGALDTDPLTRVQAGWCYPAGSSEAVVYVVMVEQADPGDRPREQVANRLSQFSREVTRLVLATVQLTAGNDLATDNETAQANNRSRLPTNRITVEEALDGWLALFDGATTYGFADAQLSAAEPETVISGGATTTEFTDFELRVGVTQAGELVLPDRTVMLQPGTHTLTSRGKRGPIRLNQGFAVSRLNLKPLELKSLFNGRDYSGWERRGRIPTASKPGAVWSISDRAMRVVGGPEALEYAPLNGPHMFADFLLQLEGCTRRAGTNGGLFIRNEPGRTMMGYEIQLHHSWYDPKGARHGYTTGGIDDRLQARAAVAVDHLPFRLTVVALGPHLATWVNGYQTADWIDTRPPHTNPRSGLRLESGTLQIQAHDPETDLEIRQVLLRPY